MVYAVCRRQKFGSHIAEGRRELHHFIGLECRRFTVHFIPVQTLGEPLGRTVEVLPRHTAEVYESAYLKASEPYGIGLRSRVQFGSPCQVFFCFFHYYLNDWRKDPHHLRGGDSDSVLKRFQHFRTQLLDFLP